MNEYGKHNGSVYDSESGMYYLHVELYEEIFSYLSPKDSLTAALAFGSAKTNYLFPSRIASPIDPKNHILRGKQFKNTYDVEQLEQWLACEHENGCCEDVIKSLQNAGANLNNWNFRKALWLEDEQNIRKYISMGVDPNFFTW